MNVFKRTLPMLAVSIAVLLSASGLVFAHHGAAAFITKLVGPDGNSLPLFED